MTTKPDSVKAGVGEAWDFWLSQHDVSVPETIHDAVKEAVNGWLNRHGDDLFREAIAEAVRDQVSATVDRPTPTQARARRATEGQNADDLAATCPACDKAAYYIRQLDRFIHKDASPHDACWLALVRGQIATTD